VPWGNVPCRNHAVVEVPGDRLELAMKGLWWRPGGDNIMKHHVLIPTVLFFIVISSIKAAMHSIPLLVFGDEGPTARYLVTSHQPHLKLKKALPQPQIRIARRSVHDVKKDRINLADAC